MSWKQNKNYISIVWGLGRMQATLGKQALKMNSFIAEFNSDEIKTFKIKIRVEFS